MIALYQTRQFLKNLAACRNDILKDKIIGRFASLEEQIEKCQFSCTLRYYTPTILIMKFFGALNSRIIIQKEQYRGVTLYIVRQFIDKNQYQKLWRNCLEPEISAGIYNKKYPLSMDALKAAFADYQHKLAFERSLLLQFKNENNKNFSYMKDAWFFIQHQYKRAIA